MNPSIRAAGRAYEQALRQRDQQIRAGTITPETMRRVADTYGVYLTARTSSPTKAMQRFIDHGRPYDHGEEI